MTQRHADRHLLLAGADLHWYRRGLEPHCRGGLCALRATAVRNRSPRSVAHELAVHDDRIALGDGIEQLHGALRLSCIESATFAPHLNLRGGSAAEVPLDRVTGGDAR